MVLAGGLLRPDYCLHLVVCYRDHFSARVEMVGVAQNLKTPQWGPSFTAGASASIKLQLFSSFLTSFFCKLVLLHVFLVPKHTLLFAFLTFVASVLRLKHHSILSSSKSHKFPEYFIRAAPASRPTALFYKSFCYSGFMRCRELMVRKKEDVRPFHL